MAAKFTQSITRSLSRTWKIGRAKISGGEAPLYKAKAFEDLQSYYAIQKYRVIGKTLSIQNPWFREHEARNAHTAVIGGRKLHSFTSYDYLGLNQSPIVADAAKRAIDSYGTSVSASRLVAGERRIHRELESLIAEHYETDDAVVFVSGHATNVSAIGELMSSEDLIVHDEWMHNSAIVGAKLSGATVKSFPHNDLAALEQVLADNRGKYKNALVLVEGLYSMDGDYPDLPRIIALKQKYGCWLMVDEAHGLGVLGKTGRGVFEHFDLDPALVDIWMGTLSKTLGACGGYIAGSQALIDIMKYKAGGFVYSVGMSPPLTVAAITAMHLMYSEPDRVERLQRNGRVFLDEARRAGLDTGVSKGFAVVPIIVGDGVKAIRLTDRLNKRGVNVLPILYPAVPLKSARLRFFITSEHTEEQIKETVRITKEELEKIETRLLNVVDSAIGRLGK
jgi:8-amino-7-oxononanoate synthase